MSSPGPTKSICRSSKGPGERLGTRGLWVWIAALGTLLAALGLTLVPGTLGGVGAQSTRPAVVVGLVAPFEGLLRWEGYRLLYAVKLALKEANAQGGVGGYSIVLVALDDGHDPVRAERVARQMAADPAVVGVIGHFSTATTDAASPVYTRFGVPLVVPLAPAAETPAHEGVFYMAPGPLEREVETGSSEEPFVPLDSIVDETEVWSTLAGREEGESALYWLGPEMCHPTMARLLAGLPASVGCGALASVDEARWPTFGEAYRAFSGALPSVRAGLAYDAAWAVLRALAQVPRAEGSPEALRAGVREALREVRFAGVTGEVLFDAQGRRLGPGGGAWLLVPEVRPWRDQNLARAWVAGP